MMELTFEVRVYRYEQHASRVLRLSAKTAADLADVVTDIGPGLVALIQKTITEAAAQEEADDAKAE